MRLRNRLIMAAAVMLLAGLARPGLRWFEQAQLYHPSRIFKTIPADSGLACEDAALRSSDGTRIQAWFLPAEKGPLSGQKLVLMYCHGNAGNMGNRVHKVSILQRLGLNVLLFDYRGYGKSEGKPSEEGTYLDAEAAYRYLAQDKGFPPERIIIYGESLGGAIALETALRHAPKVLILDSTFTSIVDMCRRNFSWLPAGRVVTLRYDNLAKIPRIHFPLMILHSREDRVVPFSMGQALFAAAPQPKEFVVTKGRHGEGYVETGEAYPQAVLAFLRHYAL